MNWETIQGKWDQVKGEVRKTWGQLTDDQVEQIGGSWDQLVGAIQEKYGVAKEEAERQVQQFMDRFDQSA